MSRDSGWIVTRNGVWIPVAHNASVSETSDWKHASFEGLDGTRRIAGRGRKPREWEITETVPYDWAQELYTLYMTNDGLEPVFFIPRPGSFMPVTVTVSSSDLVLPSVDTSNAYSPWR